MGSVTISVSTLLVLVCTAIAAAVLAFLMAGVRRNLTNGSIEKTAALRTALLLCVALIAILAIAALLIFGVLAGGEQESRSAEATPAATPGNKEQATNSDPLNGKVFVTEGSSSGGMYTEGQAFYFEDGRVYVGLPGDSEAALKVDSLLYTPYDMYYTIEGEAIEISGGGYTSNWTYNESADTIRAGSTTMTRGN